MFGILNCNKPIGFSSRDLVNVVQGRLGGRRVKIGHCGTLDPLADGVLVIGVGPAAKLVPYVHESSKCYAGSFQLGAESPTGDLEVEPTVHKDHPVPTATQIDDACQKLTGMIEQVPPAYSAIKIGGKRAYDLVRKGHDVDIPSRTVKIESIEVVSYDYPQLKLNITCGTGTYIRTLGLDLAKAVGTVAVMTGLTRTRVGDFSIDESVTVDKIRSSELESLLLPPLMGVAHLPRMTIDSDESVRLVNGLGLDGRQPEPMGEAMDQEHATAVTPTGHLKAILVEKNGRWCPKRVFPD